MKKMILSTLLVISSIAVAEPIRIINVFYDGRYGQLTVNTQKGSAGDLDFIRTNKILLVSSDQSECNKGCNATIKANENSSFSIIVNGQTIASVETNDVDDLLSSSAFKIIEKNGEVRLVLLLDNLNNDKRAKVR